MERPQGTTLCLTPLKLFPTVRLSCLDMGGVTFAEHVSRGESGKTTFR